MRVRLYVPSCMYENEGGYMFPVIIKTMKVKEGMII